MATNFPSSLDSYATKTDNVDNVMAAHVNDPQDAIEAIEAKVGIDSSAVATSVDYLLKNTSSANPGHKHTLANSATDVTATAGEINTACDGSTAKNSHTHSYVQMKTGTYVGDGADDRSINIGIDLAAATYKWLVIKTAIGSYFGTQKFGHDTGDMTNFFADGSGVTNHIQAWTATGFQIGSNTTVNFNGATFNYVVFYQV